MPNTRSVIPDTGSWHHRNEIVGSKVLMFHAKDDPMPYQRTREFAKLTGAGWKSIKRGGHTSTDHVVKRYWQIKKLFESA